jgi:hypothetical protein
MSDNHCGICGNAAETSEVWETSEVCAGTQGAKLDTPDYDSKSFRALSTGYGWIINHELSLYAVQSSLWKASLFILSTDFGNL